MEIPPLSGPAQAPEELPGAHCCRHSVLDTRTFAWSEQLKILWGLLKALRPELFSARTAHWIALSACAADVGKCAAPMVAWRVFHCMQ